MNKTNNPIAEFTVNEFEEFLKKNDYEAFSAENVAAFAKDFLTKSQNNELDEFEKSCGAAEYATLHPAIVVGEDLVKRTVYYRESQIESIEIPEGIFKSIDDRMCYRYKDTDLNRMKGIAGINCADVEEIKKAKKSLPIGTEKTYGGKLYIKTEKGWRPKSKGAKESEKKDNSSKIPEGVDEAQYNAIVNNTSLTPSIHNLKIDGEAIKIERRIDTSGGQRTKTYQTEGSSKKYWDLDKLIEAHRKDKKSDDKTKDKFAREVEEAHKVGAELDAKDKKRAESGEKVGADEKTLELQRKLIEENKNKKRETPKVGPTHKNGNW